MLVSIAHIATYAHEPVPELDGDSESILLPLLAGSCNRAHPSLVPLLLPLHVRDPLHLKDARGVRSDNNACNIRSWGVPLAAFIGRSSRQQAWCATRTTPCTADGFVL